MNSKYYSQLEELFNFYAKLEDQELNREVLKSCSVIQSKSFIKFAQQFNIIPTIVTENEISFIFTNAVRNKRTYGKDNIKALTKEDFLEAIVKICILGKHNLGVPIEEIPINKDNNSASVRGFNLKGVDVSLVEKLLKTLGLTPGEKKGPIIQILKKIKQIGRAHV